VLLVLLLLLLLLLSVPTTSMASPDVDGVGDVGVDGAVAASIECGVVGAASLPLPLPLLLLTDSLSSECCVGESFRPRIPLDIERWRTETTGRASRDDAGCSEDEQEEGV
jgi:hypothetical protein